MSLAKKTAQGVFWNYVSFGGGKLLTFVSTIILARILAPEQFGQVALALLVITYLDAIGDLGVGAALIYQRDNVQHAARVTFTISVLMGFVLWAIATGAAPMVGAYFGEPEIAPMLRVLALTFIIQSFGNTHNALISKELNFKRKLIPDLTRTFTKGGSAIVLALMGWGAWSLIWGQVIGSIATTLALWIAQPWKPGVAWDIHLGRRMLSYGLQIIGIELLAVFWTTADYTIIGKLLGKTDLALYRQAFLVADMLIISMCWVTGRVLFPSYAKISNDNAALQRGILLTIRYISLVTMPLSFGLAAIALPFTAVVYGDQWLAMTPALQLLALRAGISTLSFNSGHAFKAIGRPDVVTKQMIVKLGILIPTVLISVRFGFVGVAVGQVIVAIISVLIDFGTVMYLIRIPARTIWEQIQPSLFSAALMGGLVWLVVDWLDVAPILILIGGITLGVAAYVASLWLFQRPLVVESARSVMQLLRPERVVPADR